MDRRAFVAGAATLPLAVGADAHAAGLPEINGLIEQSVLKLHRERAGGGYGGPAKGDMSYAFTQNLSYPGADAIPQSPRNPNRPDLYKRATMCVAGVGEVMIEALNLYAGQPARGTDDVDVYKRLPVGRWTGGKILDFRPYLWVQEDSADVFRYTDSDTPKVVRKDGSIRHAVSRGSAHAFKTFNMGQELPFSALRRGDFINLNRAGAGGHAVIFWNYISNNNTYTPTHADDVLGFQYFSAQGPKIGGGFDFRDAYFGPEKHVGPSAGSTKDPGIIRRQSSQLWLNSGRLWDPRRWNIQKARDDIQKLASSRTDGTRGATDALLDQDLGPSVVQFTDGDEV